MASGAYQYWLPELGKPKSDNVDWTTIRPMVVGDKILKTFGQYTETTTFTIPDDGFLTFTAKVTGKGSARIQNASGNILLGGISYIDSVPDIQIDYCVPVRKGDQLTAFITFSGSITKLVLLEAVRG